MANFKDQLNIAKQLNDLTRQRMRDEKFMDSTLDDRVSILNNIVQNKKDINKLSDIEQDIEKKISDHIETGHTALADKYKVELKLVQIKKKELEAQENVNDALKEAGDSLLGGMITKGKELTETLKKPGGVLVVGLTAAVALLLTFSKTTDKIGEQFGALGVNNLAQDLREANVTAVGLGRGIDDVSNSLEEVANNFGVSAKNSKDLLNSITEVSVATGLTNQEGAQLFGTFKSIVGLTDEQAENLAKQTALLADQEGLLPNAVFRDIVGSTDAIAGFTKDGGKNIARAAIEAKKLGTNLDTAAKIADGLLDFETSIESALEASLLIGRNINLDKARQLALSGDLAGAMKDVVAQVGSEAEFNKLNVIQRDALAKAVGVSRGELAKFVQLQGKSKSEMAALTDMDVSELVPEEAISNITMLNNTIKKITASIQAAIGGFIQFLGITTESSVGADLTKIALIALGGAIVFIGVTALASALKIKLMSKILGKSGLGFAKFGLAASAAIPILLTLAAVGLSISAVFFGISAVIGSVGELLSKNISASAIAGLALALTGLAASLMAVGVAGLFALPALGVLSAFGMLPGQGGGGAIDDGQPKAVHDKDLEEKVSTLQSEIEGLRSDMASYFGTGGSAYPEMQRAHSTALENFS